MYKTKRHTMKMDLTIQRTCVTLKQFETYDKIFQEHIKKINENLKEFMELKKN